ncbi:hypothetical protein [Puia dinghuensis]|uniref:Uncharacterized protein n=1 Tax=Puia dinghuensis TaxID=1792502 RepID=A0A8J2U783_9BACT|nr:hypothetical protein [Puia dinghuensis]GGA83321.1 hypothetical protein GCM10011511_02970 [Puia dinghuensis]
MSTTFPSPLPASPVAVRPRADSGRVTVPLSIYAVSLASLLTMVGILWDISWHRSIGRDKFLSPPHILVYLGAIFAGLFSGIRVLYNSFFRKEAAKATDVRVWGVFYSPLGALFCIWGSIAMLTSAPFDDWWHNAYGLDVTILSPPHTLLAMGMICLQLGACVSICKYLNADDSGRAGGRRGVLQTLFVISALSLLTMVYTLFTDYLHLHGMRSGSFYIIAAMASLLLLPAFGLASRMRWGMTAVTGGYFLLVLFSNWILELFPAEPKLGPILSHITHFQPANFPALVIVPAMAMDLILQRSKAGDWLKALWLSLAFVGLLVAVQYPLSGFLLESPNARNWFFTSNSTYFGVSPNWPWRYRFRPQDVAPLPELLRALVIAVVVGWLCARLSLRWGKWMQHIQR